MKTYILLTSMLLLLSCVQESPKQEVSATTTNPSGQQGGQQGGIQAITPAIVRVKNYNQYNQSLEKLTKLSRAKYNTLFEELKGSLPADNDIGGLTSFNLIAMTRLADAYCKDWVDREETLGLNGKLNPLKAYEVREFLINSFLDVDKDEKFSSLRAEVDNVLANDDGAGEALFPGYMNNTAGNKNIVLAACVSVLASPYITLLE